MKNQSVAKHFILFFLLSIYILSPVKSQDSTKFFQHSSEFNSKRFNSVLISEIGLYSATMIGLNEAWYKDYPRSSFHFFDDNEEWFLMDKAGHFCTAYYLGKLGKDVLRWSGVENKKAIIYGGSFGWMFLTSVEILDGFSTQWGFSTGDFAANAVGSALFIGQELGWKEQRINIKYSFHETEFPQYRKDQLGSTFAEHLIKDYNGQTYWLSANISSFLKDENKFPKWLNVAFGYGADGLLGARFNPEFNKQGIKNTSFERYRQYYFSLDVDLTRIKTKSKFLNTVFQTIGFIKFPAPALEFNKIDGVKVRGIYF